MEINRIGIKWRCVVDFSIFGYDLFKRTSKAMLEAKVVKSTDLLEGSKIRWNFTKFLIDQNGNVVKRFATTTKPEEIAKDIEKLLVK